MKTSVPLSTCDPATSFLLRFAAIVRPLPIRWTRMILHLIALGCFANAQAVAQQSASRGIVVWHGDTQRVGHLGGAQDDFNLMSRIEA